MIPSAVRNIVGCGGASTHRALTGSVLTGAGLQGLLVISGVLAARILGPTDRGNLALLAAIPSVVCQVGGIGISLAVTYFIAKSPARACSVVRTIWRFAAIQIVVLICIDAAILAALSPGKPHEFQVAAVLSVMAVPGTMFAEYGLAILQGQHRFGIVNAFRLLPSAIYGALLFTCFLTHGGHLVTVTALAFGSLLVFGVLTLAMAMASLPAEPRPTPFSQREIIAFGVKGFTGSLSPIDTFRLDQLCIGLLISPAALGVYVVGAAFSNLPRFVAQSIGMVASPKIAASERESRHRLSWRFGRIAIVICGGIVLVLELLVPSLVHLLFGTQFRSAVLVARILLIGAFFVSVRRVFTDCSRGAGYPALGVVGEIAALLSLAPLLPLFGYFWGVNGVAAAFAISAAIGCLSLVGAFRTTIRQSRFKLRFQRRWETRKAPNVKHGPASLPIALGTATCSVGFGALLAFGAGLVAFPLVACACMLGLALSIVASLRWVASRDGDALSLLTLSGLFYVLAYCGGGVYYWVAPGARYGSLTNHADLLWAIEVGAGSWLLLLIGYVTNPLRLLARALPNLPDTRRAASIHKTVIPLLVVGWIARLIEIGTGRYFHSPSSGEIISTSSTQFVAILAVLPTLAIAFLGAHDYIRNRNRGAGGMRIVYRILLIIEACWYIPAGARGTLIGLLIMVAVLRYYGLGRRIPWRTVALYTALVVLIVFPFGLAYRGDNVTYQKDPRGSLTRAASTTFSRTPVKAVEAGLTATFSRFSDVMSLALIHSRGRAPGDIEGGKSLKWAAGAAIPRAILKSKYDPGQYGNQFGRAYGLLYERDFITSVSVTQPGDLYLGFGLLGLFIGMPIVGALYRALNDYLRPRSWSPAYLAIYSVMAWPLVIGHETILALGLAGVARSIIVYALLIILLDRLHRHSAASLSPAEPGGPKQPYPVGART